MPFEHSCQISTQPGRAKGGMGERLIRVHAYAELLNQMHSPLALARRHRLSGTLAQLAPARSCEGVVQRKKFVVVLVVVNVVVLVVVIVVLVVVSTSGFSLHCGTSLYYLSGQSLDRVRAKF